MKWLYTVCILVIAVAAQTPAKKTPVVMIVGNGNEIYTRAFGVGSSSKHDQTIEMAQQLLKHCPEVTLTIGEEQKPDYELVLNREGGGFFDIGDSQIMLVRGGSKEVLWASAKGTVAKAVKEGCRQILSDWREKQHQHIPERGDDWWQATPKKEKPQSSHSDQN